MTREYYIEIIYILDQCQVLTIEHNLSGEDCQISYVIFSSNSRHISLALICCGTSYIRSRQHIIILARFESSDFELEYFDAALLKEKRMHLKTFTF